MKNIIIDGNNMLYRVAAQTTKFVEKKNKEGVVFEQGRADGWILHSFFRDLYRNTKEFHDKDTTIYVVWDKKLDSNSSNWRNEVIPQYKQQRSKSELRDTVHRLTKNISQVCMSMGIYSIFPFSVEGDDIINELKNTLDGETVIVSLDQDFYQCIDENTSVYNPTKDLIINEKNFLEVVGVESDKFVLYKSIMGDTSDNIGGLYRYGKVKATKLANNWEEGKEKLDDEQLATIDKAVEVIDLNSRPLPDNDKHALDLQLGADVVKFSDYELTKVLDAYDFPHELRMSWDNYFNLKEFQDILS